jgi:hypothetical protein
MNTKNHKPGRLAIGSLSPKSTGAHFIPKRIEFEDSGRITNAGSSGTYTGERWHTRPGSDHSHLKSRGISC